MRHIEVSPVIYGFDIETNQYFDYSNLYKCKTVFHDYFDWKYIKEHDYVCSIKQAHDAFERLIVDMQKAIRVSDLSKQEALTAVSLQKLEFDKAVLTGHDLVITGNKRNRRAISSKLVPLYSELYLGCFIKHDFDYDVVSKTLKDIKDSVTSAKAKYVYTIDDVDKVFRNIEDETLNKYDYPMCTVVCIHNLSYEMQLIRQTEWFKDKVRNGLVDALGNGAKDTFKTVVIKYRLPDGDEIGVIKFVDTWKLTNSSIDNLGKAYGLYKLDYDYEEIRKKEDLTSVDYEYNRRDVEISLIAFLNTIGTYKKSMFRVCAKNSSGFLIMSNMIPISANHAVNIFSSGKFHDDEFYRNKEVKRIMKEINEDMYRKFKRVCGGGLVTINPLLAYNEIKLGTVINGFAIRDIVHIDLNSAHPSQVYKRLFPVSAPVEITDAEYLLYIKTELEECIKRFRKIDMLKPFAHIGYNIGRKSYSGFGVFRLSNVSIKRYAECIEIPVAWKSKLYDVKSGMIELDIADTEIITVSGENIKTNRDKIISAEWIEMNITLEDLEIISLFYDFELESVNEFYEYEMGYANKFLIDQIDYFAEEKTTYKKFTKLVNKYGMTALKNELLNSPYILETDKQELMTALNTDELEKIAEDCLRRAKARFNGIYGTTYQSIIREQLILQISDSDVEYITNDYYQVTNKKIHFLQGAYIAQWSRVDIALWAFVSIQRGYIPFYIATDSIYMGVIEKTDTFSDAELSNGFNIQIPVMSRKFPNKTGLGGMSAENTIVRLEYIDCLKIIYDEVLPSGEIKTRETISGTNAEVLFKNVNPYERLLQENIYVSAFENGKLIKRGGTEDNPFRVFVPSAVLLNDTDSKRYIENKEYSIRLQ